MSTFRCERITRREQKIARTRANCLLQEMRRCLRDRYRMTFRIAGSGCWGTMIKKPDGSYDLDYQIFITRNSKDYESVKKDPKKVKDAIRNTFDRMRNTGESFKDSTTAITLTNSLGSVHYTIDFVILTEIDGETNIIRQDKTSKPPRYFWNQLPQKYEDSYRYFKGLGSDEKKTIIDKVIERKCREIHKAVKDKSSSEILIEEINNHAHGKGIHL
ncbi:MAG: hypothetical protein II855_03000 [Candidatus Methanomethylophilaceae archaeon]|nr:hypothetical protein [Candidatus Methanomethylophilaceae archaeon]